MSTPLSTRNTRMHSMNNQMDSTNDPTQDLEDQLKKVRGSSMNLISSMSALREELSYANEEIAFGIYSYDDLKGLLHQLEGLMVPLLGLFKISTFEALSQQTNKHVKNIESAVYLSFKSTLAELDYGLRCTELLLNSNSYYSSPISIPEDLNRQEITNESDEKSRMGIEFVRQLLASNTFTKDDKDVEDKSEDDPIFDVVEGAEQYLYILYLLQSASKAAQELSGYVKSQLSSNSTRRAHLIFPELANFPFIGALFNRSPNNPSVLQDPEHLPPRNKVEIFGNLLRRTLSSLGSDSSKFGLRVLVATMSIGIMGFLENTQHFFVRYRILWVVVMIPISMSPTAGTAIYGFVGRASGVTAAMLLAYVNWYVVDGKPGGVLVMFFLSMMVYYGLLIKYPRYIVLFILAAANHVLIIGK